MNFKARILFVGLSVISAQSVAYNDAIVERVRTYVKSAAQLSPSIGIKTPDVTSVIEPQFYELKRGQSLSHLLAQAGLSSIDIYSLVGTVRPLYNLEKVRAGSLFEVTPDPKGLRLRFAASYGVIIEATKLDSQWLVSQLSLPIRAVPITKSVEINHSLYKAASKADIPANIINSAILAMSHFVDFQREIRKGDKLTLKFRQSLIEQSSPLFDHLSPPQQLMAIEFENNNAHHRLYHYRDAFYFDDGKLAQNFLLKTPLNGARLSSTFGNRKHPVLGYSRKHKGVDFSAPLGTPIMAAGRGKVVKANYSDSFGYNVLLDHGDGYRTLYAHLKGFAKGIKAGVQVTQGQTIGFLGNTGLSTARHLHYEVHQHGIAINPLSLKQPSHIQLKGKDLIAFQTHIKTIDERYAKHLNEQAQLTN